ncbi:Xaa-Pro aminopeptidase [Malassezia cuniculi]|uniref:Exocyst complex component Sec8 n=1 Tax=Malassezia cuniculi TaxID=948313 RepID=A0AAF0EXD6_9BASI|nr:Xaa-Pro aminopeptidase [Malassezia cuniculi]
MLKRPGGSKKLRAQIRHENQNLGAGAGITTGPIEVPGHNTLPHSGRIDVPRDASPYASAQPGRTVGEVHQPPPVHAMPVAPAAPAALAAPATQPMHPSIPNPSTPQIMLHAPEESPSPVDPVVPPVRPARTARAPGHVAPPDVDAPLRGVRDRLRRGSTPSLAPAPSPAPLSSPSPAPSTLSLAAADGPSAPPGQLSLELPPTPVKPFMPDGPATPAAPFGSLTHEREPAALGSVLSALSAAGRKHQTERIVRGANRARRAQRVVMDPRPSEPLNSYVTPADEPRFRQLNAVLRKVRGEWGFIAEDGFSAIDLALALRPGGSLRAHLGPFSELQALIEHSMQGTLDDHYESFASAITLNHSVINVLGDVQGSISGARQKLRGARDALGARRTDLVQMWQRLESVKEALGVLAVLERLRGVPDELESLMSAKRFLAATQLLMRSLRLIQRDDMAEIGATADLRSYLRSQEHILLEILLEELHNHIYLKSYYCDVRWQSYKEGQSMLPDVSFGVAHETQLPDMPTKLGGFLAALQNRAPDADLSESIDGDSPESDSFLYVEMLLESLGRLGKLDYALEVIGQRLPHEIHQLVDATVDEVDARHDARSAVPVKAEALFLASSSLSSLYASGVPHRSLALAAASDSQSEYAALQRDMETLRDLFWTLFSKLDAVLQCWRVVCEVANDIAARSELRGKPMRVFESGTAALARVWQPIQHEISALLHDYVSEETQMSSASAHTVPAVVDVLRVKKYERDRSAPIFFMDTQRDSVDVKHAEETVTSALRTFVPGLVGTDSSATERVSLVPLAPADDASPGGHRLLVRPLVFTVSVLFQPTFAFVQRVEHVLPLDAGAPRGFGAFLDEFVRDVFLPVLEERVHDLVTRGIGSPDAFAADPSTRSKVSRPLAKSAASMVALVDSLFAMLLSAPFHKESYARLVVLTLVEYYRLCNERFKTLVATDDGYLAASLWAQRQELASALATKDSKKEAALLLEYAVQSPLRRTDLITSRKRQLALGTLHHSLHWFIERIDQLTVKVNGRDAPDRAGSASSTPTAATHNTLELPLEPQLAQRYAQVPNMYRQLARTLLGTMRTELRTKTIFYIGLAIREGSYVVDAVSLDPDPFIIDLNAELAACHEAYRETVLSHHHSYLFDGLDALMDELLVDAILHVHAANRHGVTKMMRNILSLQQNLKNIVAAPLAVNLERSKRVWELVAKDPATWVRTPDASLPAEHHIAILRLAHGVAPDCDASDMDVPVPRLAHAGTVRAAARTEYTAHLQLLRSALGK